MTSTSFSLLSITDNMRETLKSLAYDKMTPIQAKALPHILELKDIIAQAKTGSGKTAAFAIGLLQKHDVKLQHVQSIVLCPTRELAEQVSQEIRRLARLIPNVRLVTLCGGKSFKTQAIALEHGAQIVVGTPGRVLDHLNRATLILDKASTLVLDEADRMLDMGFEEDLARIIISLPKQRQTLLFSATYPDEIKTMSDAYLTNPVEVRVESIHEESTIKQLFYKTKNKERNAHMLRLLQHYKLESTLIFCNTKIKCNEVERYLKDNGFNALALHGDMEQKDRTKILIQFANKSCPILVATDVAARGLDIDNLEAVINYELSNSAQTHMHRIGRTGRAGRTGLSLSLYTEQDEYRLLLIEEAQKTPIVSKTAQSLEVDSQYKQQAKMRTLCLSAGKKQKIRPGDIVGALTGELSLEGASLGKINITDYYAYVAIEAKTAQRALHKMTHFKIKNKQYKAYLMS